MKYQFYLSKTLMVPTNSFYNSAVGFTIFGKNLLKGVRILTNLILGYINYANGTGAVVFVRVSIT